MRKGVISKLQVLWWGTFFILQDSEHHQRGVEIVREAFLSAAFEEIGNFPGSERTCNDVETREKRS